MSFIQKKLFTVTFLKRNPLLKNFQSQFEKHREELKNNKNHLKLKITIIYIEILSFINT